MMRWNGWGMGSTWLFWLAILVAVAVFYLARQSWQSSKRSVEEILRERFARGEISKEQYEDRLKTLRQT